MEHATTCSVLSGEIPFSNTLNTHCDICSRPISQSDVNVLRPCECGPFHSYCISNLELETREPHPRSSPPKLKCPRCRQTVTTVLYDFNYGFPRASRQPFTPTTPSQAPPVHPSQPRVLPMAIYDSRPKSPKPPHGSFYVPPPVLPIAQSWPTPSENLPDLPNRYPLSHKPEPLPAARTSNLRLEKSQELDYTPSAPPLSSLEDCLPPPSQDFKPATFRPTKPQGHLGSTDERRRVSSYSGEDSPLQSEKILHLPSPYNEIPRSPQPPHSQGRRCESDLGEKRSHRRSPRSVLVCKEVNVEDLKKSLRGEDIHKAYVYGKAGVSGAKKNKGLNGLNVKVDMNLHIYHHWEPSPQVKEDREKRKSKAADKSWWKSPRTMSRAESREGRIHDDRQHSRSSPARKW